MPENKIYDVIVVGGGQSGLACGYYLRKSNLSFLILDKFEKCGGSWQKSWDSLKLFSPAEHSSLPGWLMPKTTDYPGKDHVIEYLCNYEKRYNLPVERPLEVSTVSIKNNLFQIETTKGSYTSKTLISATGTYSSPVIPEINGREKFIGLQIHSSEYRNPEQVSNKKVLVVGEGNSGAQILAEVSKVTEAKWATLEKPQFLPEDVDGRVLFNVASAKYHAQKNGKFFEPENYNIGNIVMVPEVKKAVDRNALKSSGRIDSITTDGVIWTDGEEENFDAIIWCTGFNFSTNYLADLLKLNPRGKVETNGTRSIEVDGLWLVGYGNWTGFASATIIGVGRTARQTVKEIEDYLK